MLVAVERSSRGLSPNANVVSTVSQKAGISIPQPRDLLRVVTGKSNVVH